MAVETLYNTTGGSHATVTTTREPNKRETIQETQAPSPEVKGWLDGKLAPMAESMGIDYGTGKVRSFRDAIGYDPEEERKRREQQIKNEQWRRKEAGWHSAFQVLGDALSAAHGGIVVPREADNTAAQAGEAERKLIDEQKAENAATQKGTRDTLAAWNNYQNNFTKDYLRKVTTTTTDYGEQTRTTDKDPVHSSKQVQEKISPAGKSSSGGSGASPYSFAVTIGNDKMNEYSLGRQEYLDVRGVLQARYAALLNEKDANGNPTKNAEAAKNWLVNQRIISVNSNGNVTWNQDQIMRCGKFFGLTDVERKAIKDKSGGRVTLSPSGSTAKKPQAKTTSTWKPSTPAAGGRDDD